MSDPLQDLLRVERIRSALEAARALVTERAPVGTGSRLGTGADGERAGRRWEGAGRGTRWNESDGPR